MRAIDKILEGWEPQPGLTSRAVVTARRAPIVRVGGHRQRVYRPVKLGAAARSPLDLFGVHTLLANRPGIGQSE